MWFNVMVYHTVLVPMVPVALRPTRWDVRELSHTNTPQTLHSFGEKKNPMLEVCYCNSFEEHNTDFFLNADLL